MRTNGRVKLTDNHKYEVDECIIKIVKSDRNKIKGVVNKKGIERVYDLFNMDD